MKKRLATFIQVVVFLFAAFGGFLKNITPPAQTNPKFGVGLSSFLALILLLIVSAVAAGSPEKKARKTWITVGGVLFLVAISAGILYPWTLDKLTYAYPPPPDAPEAWHVNGWELTQTARDFIQTYPGNWTPGQLELKLPYEDIWTRESVAKAKILLLINYVAFVLSIAAAIFCLLEANLKKQASRTAPKKKPQ